MHQPKSEPTTIFIADAAAILGVSNAAVRQWRRNGVLDAAELDACPAVTMASVRKFVAALQVNPELTLQRRNLRRGAKRPYLRLVVDNT
jgi:hypothetical protein